MLGRFVGQIGLPERSVNDCVYHESFSPQVILSPAARRHNGQVELLPVCPETITAVGIRSFGGQDLPGGRVANAVLQVASKPRRRYQRRTGTRTEGIQIRVTRHL